MSSIRRDGGAEVDEARPWPADPPRGPAITIEVDGKTVRAFAGEPVAVALYAAGMRLLGRSPKYHRPRGLFCASGHCASCLMRIDGQPNLRACLTPAREALRCERQNALPNVELDLLRAADWLFPHGMDHHRLMTGTRLGNDLFVKLVRQMGGTGLLPDRPALALPAARVRLVDVCVVGAGPAGLSAARAIAEAKPDARVLLVDEHEEAGGSWLAEPEGAAMAAAAVAAARAAGVEVVLSATALAHYPEDQVPGAARGVLALGTREGLLKVAARQTVYATGAYDQNLPFPGNDRPGVLSARACGRLAFRFGVRPGKALHVLVDPAQPFAYAARLRAGLAARGVSVTERPYLEAPSGALAEDAVAVAALPAPASELARQHGVEVTFDEAAGGFVPAAAARQTAAARGVFIAGDAAGYKGPEAAAAEGAAIGLDVARSC